MQSGKRRYRVTFQRSAKVQDAIGGWVDGWEDVGKAWVSIHPVSGRTWMAAAQDQREVTSEILIPPRKDLLAGMRVLYGASVYEIVAPLLDLARRELKLMCKTVKTNG